MKKLMGIVLVAAISLCVANPQLTNWLRSAYADLPACSKCQCKMINAYAQLTGDNSNTGYGFYQLSHDGKNYTNAFNASGSTVNSDQKTTGAWIMTNSCPEPNSSYYVTETKTTIKRQQFTNLTLLCSQAYDKKNTYFVEATSPSGPVRCQQADGLDAAHLPAQAGRVNALKIHRLFGHKVLRYKKPGKFVSVAPLLESSPNADMAVVTNSVGRKSLLSPVEQSGGAKRLAAPETFRVSSPNA